jgi:hypothetical protein
MSSLTASEDGGILGLSVRKLSKGDSRAAGGLK